MSVRISTLPVGTTLAGTEKIPALQSGDMVATTANALATLAITTLGAATVVSPSLMGDKLPMFRSGVVGEVAIDTLASYVISTFNYTGMSAVTPLVTGDLMSIDRSGVLKKATVETVATYAIKSMASATPTTPLTGDGYLFYRGGSPYVASIDALVSYVLDSTTFTSLSAVTPAVTGDYLEIDRSGVMKKITVDTMSAFAIKSMAGETATAPVTGDKYLFYRSGTAYVGTVDALSTLAFAAYLNNAVNPLLSTDTILAARGTTAETITVANLEAQLVTDISSTILAKTATLTLADSLNAGDKYLVCQTGSPFYTTLTILEAKIHGDFAAYAAALTNVGTLASGDQFYAVHSSTTPKSVLASDIATYTQTYVWTNATAVTTNAAAAGDLFLTYRAATGTMKMDIDTLATYVAPGTQTYIWANASTAASSLTGDKLLMYRTATGTMQVTIDTLSTFMLGKTWGVASASSLNSGDTILAVQSNTGKQITVANLETQLKADMTQGILNNSAALTGAAGLSDGDKYMVCQSSVAYSTTLGDIKTKVYGDFATYTSNLTDIGTLAGTDQFYGIHGTTPKSILASDVGAYALSYVWANAATETSALTGDVLLMNRAGTGTIKMTVDNLATFVNTSVVGTVLNISTLTGASSINGADLLLTCQTTTPKKITVTALQQKVYDEFGNYVTGVSPWAGLPAVSTVSGAEYIYCVQGGVQKYVTPTQLYASVLAGTPVSTLLGTDLVVTTRGGACQPITVTHLETQLTADLKDPISTYTLSEAYAVPSTSSLYAADTFLIVHSGDGKQVALSDLEAKLTTDLNTPFLSHTDVLSAAGALADANSMLVCQTGVAKRTTLGDVKTKFYTDLKTYVDSLADVSTGITYYDRMFLVNTPGTTPTAKYVTMGGIFAFVQSQMYDAIKINGASEYTPEPLLHAVTYVSVDPEVPTDQYVQLPSPSAVPLGKPIKVINCSSADSVFVKPYSAEWIANVNGNYEILPSTSQTFYSGGSGQGWFV